MALKTYPDVPQFMACELIKHTITAGEGTANEVDITLDRPVTACIVQIQAETTGVVYATGLSAVITTVTTAGSESCTITVAGTDVVAGMILNIIAW